MDFSLKNRIAWVTGSSRGIGRAVAELLAEAGCSVAIHGRNQTNLRTSGEGTDLDSVAQELSQKYGVKVIAECGELTDDKAVWRCADEIRAKLGTVDFLVCCAGGANLTGELDRNAGADRASVFDMESLRKRMEHNLLPTLLCCREIIPDMRKKGFGRIVTIGSIAGCGGNKNNGAFMPYSLAKSTVHQYTRCLAADLRHDGIPVNCVIPGNIDTPGTHIRFGYGAPETGKSRLEALGHPCDIAQLVRFLCGPGGEYISGQCIRVDGAEQLYPC